MLRDCGRGFVVDIVVDIVYIMKIDVCSARVGTHFVEATGWMDSDRTTEIRKDGVKRRGFERGSHRGFGGIFGDGKG